MTTQTLEVVEIKVKEEMLPHINYKVGDTYAVFVNKSTGRRYTPKEGFGVTGTELAQWFQIIPE